MTREWKEVNMKSKEELKIEAWKAYKKAIAPAEEAYKKAIAPAEEAYQKRMKEIEAMK